MEINASKEPLVHVGIMNEPELKFKLNGYYLLGVKKITGECLAQLHDGQITLSGQPLGAAVLEPVNYDEASFTLLGVTIGVSFHWHRKENQTFRGSIKLIVEDDKITLINVLPVEDYLMSVISSEMSATASLSLLKAHAVISRSWLMAQLIKDKSKLAEDNDALQGELMHEDANEQIKWWDRDDHVNFDVCADDHCQRYQGITRETTPTVRQAVEATRGEVLTYAGQLCDARYSKSCGGVMEQFETCWEPVHHPYLEARRDDDNETDFPNLTHEEIAADWIMSSPKAYCNTHDSAILMQVLNNYDQETTDFYRWTVRYTQQELASLLKKKTGIDFGRIRDLQPVERGTSGRLSKLKIEGELRSFTIGKELNIRYALSPTCLYSSAFIVEKLDVDGDGYPEKFALRGAGWGHGVGLCQIGAAVMGAKGFNYKQILAHYFVNATLETMY